MLGSRQLVFLGLGVCLIAGFVYANEINTNGESNELIEHENGNVRAKINLWEERSKGFDNNDKKASNNAQDLEIAYQAKLDEINKQSKLTAKENLALKEFILQHHKSTTPLNNEQKKEIKKLLQKLNELKNLSGAKAPITQQISIPYEDLIQKYQKQLEAAVVTINFRDRVGKYYDIKNRSLFLSEKLYTESQLPRTKSLEELEHSLDIKELDYVLYKDGNEDHLKAEDKVLQSKSRGSASDWFFKTVAQQRAYIEALKQVTALLDNCDHAIKFARSPIGARFF